jgi:hypothetical protein
LPEASPAFKQLLRDAFEAMQPGQTYPFRRTFTDGDVAPFRGVTGHQPLDVLKVSPTAAEPAASSAGASLGV